MVFVEDLDASSIVSKHVMHRKSEMSDEESADSSEDEIES